MQTEKISETLNKITLDDQEILLLGTAHVSKNSVDEVKTLIEEYNPDRICIELDKGRMKSKTDSNWKDMDIRKVIKEGRGFYLLATTALSSFQKRMGAETGIKPGEEILTAASLAKEKNIALSLCDRDIQSTFKRAWAKSSLWNKMKLLAVLISAVFSKEKLTEEDLENLKKNDVLQNMLEEMAKELPTVKEVLIDERDQNLARSIYETPGQKKIAVIGAGHAPGVIRTLEKLNKKEECPTLNSLTEVPKGFPWGKVVSYAIPIIIVGLILYGCLTTGWESGMRTFLFWVIVNCSCTFLTSLLSLAHPVNLILCSITAPFFALHPVLGIGMLGGIVEATIRKPKVDDFEKMADDSTTLKGWYKNKILHALLVFFLSSLGSAFGTLIAFPFLLKVF